MLILVLCRNYRCSPHIACKLKRNSYHDILISLLTSYTNSTCVTLSQTDEITYAELSLTNQQIPHVIYNQQSIPMSVIRRQEPTVYAQIDMGKRVPSCLQPLSPPHPSAFSTLPHHPHHIPAYMHRPSIRDDQMMHEGPVNAETPLINPRETSVSIYTSISISISTSTVSVSISTSTISVLKKTNFQSLQPLIDSANSRTPSVTSTLPRVTATRF